MLPLPLQLSLLYAAAALALSDRTCRNAPGDAGFPSVRDWTNLNTSVSGRLIRSVPFAGFCRTVPGGVCTDQQWRSSVFRADVPGAMNQVNWEQDYDSTPPSLCLRNGTTCGQGNVPLFAIQAESVADVQAGVRFASKHNLRLAVKASGHDYLGRSTAKDSLLISTHLFQNITFTDHFVVGRKDLGPAVTVGSGVQLRTLYAKTKEQGKFFVGGTAATVVPAGGYTQGAGHSAFSPTLGLAVDNVFQFKIVVADGRLLVANEVTDPDLFWALRGGGAGSWGVITEATFRTYPSFNVTVSRSTISVNNSTLLGRVMARHSERIFDLDASRAGQYFYVYNNTIFGTNGITLTLTTYFPNASTEAAEAALGPLLEEIEGMGATVASSTTQCLSNDVVLAPDDSVGNNVFLGSRLIPESAYRNSPEEIGAAYKELLDKGTLEILSHLVAGGQVAKNSGLNVALNPKWRSAKTHVVLVNPFLDSTPPNEVENLLNFFQNVQRPILDRIAGPKAGAYTNEADTEEPDFITVFYGSQSNYNRLVAVKRRYDPHDLFIVRSGVGSENWDRDGMCRA